MGNEALIGCVSCACSKTKMKDYMKDVNDHAVLVEPSWVKPEVRNSADAVITRFE